jgi:hypothetical protein
MHLPQLYLIFILYFLKKSINQNCIGFVVFFLSAVHCGLEPGQVKLLLASQAVHCGLEPGQVKLFLASPAIRSKRKDMWDWNRESVRG